MISTTETLCAIERRAARAIVQELHLMTKEILAMGTQLGSEQRAPAGALLKRDHLERSQQVGTVTPPAVETSVMPAPSVAGFHLADSSRPSHYLVHFYSHDVSDLEQVVLTGTLEAATQLVYQHVTRRPRPVCDVTRRPGTGELTFLAHDDVVLASILPCEPSLPAITPQLARAFAAPDGVTLKDLQLLFVEATVVPAERRAA